MPVEIERKYLLRNDDWRAEAGQGKNYQQGYLLGSDKASVRVRIEGDTAYINIKSATLGVRRMEYEYPMPMDDAHEVLKNLCEQPIILKQRYIIHYAGLEWEIDEFQGLNRGLIVAEVELQTEDQKIELPSWCGAEVSDDPRYYNVNLVKHPYSDW